MKQLLIGFLCLFLSTVQSYSQEAIALPGNSGVNLETAQIATLEEIAKSVKSNFKDGVSFNVYDCSFYAFSDEMGTGQESTIWESYQKQANNLGDNYLLLGRQFDSKSSSYKLHIQLSINPTDLECYDQEFKKEINEAIEEYQGNLDDWYAHLRSEKDLSAYEMMVEIADLASIKISKVCCFDVGSRSICEDIFDPQEVSTLRGRKIYIISQLQCLLFSDGACKDTYLNPESGLGLLDETMLDKKVDSKLKSSDKFYLIGYMQIFYPDWSVDNIYCGVVPDSKIYKKQIDGKHETVDMKMYHIGKISILIEADKDLYQLLANINQKLNSDIKELKDRVKNQDDNYYNITDNRDFIRYANSCNFEKLKEEDRLDLLTVILEFDKYEKGPLYAFWRLFNHQTPAIIRNLYDSFGEEIILDGKSLKKKTKLFKYLQENLETTVFLLEYGFPLEMKKAFFIDFCVEYTIAMLDMDDENLLLNGKPVELFFMPFEIEKALGFYMDNYRIKGDDYKSSGKFEVQFNERKWEWSISNIGSGAYADYWVHIADLNAFSPVLASNIDVIGYSEIPMIVPAVMLYNMSEFLLDENFSNALSLSFDAATSLFAIGNLAKLKRAAGLIKLNFARTEIAASVTGNIIKYTNLIPDPNQKKEILFWVAMLELGSSLGTSLPSNKTESITQFGVEKIKNLRSSPNAADPNVQKLIAAIAKALGRRGFLLRLEGLGISINHSFYTAIKALDKTTYKNTLENLYKLSDGTLLKIKDQLSAAERTVLFGDLNKFKEYSEYAEVIDELPLGVQAFGAMTGANDAAARALRTNPENLRIIDEYMYEYPEKIAAIKPAFGQADNKKEYVDGLLGPGQPGEGYVKHRVRGLYEGIDPNDDLGGILKDVNFGTNSRYTEVAPIENKPGVFIRNYYPEKNLFEFSVGYRNGAPKKLDNGNVPLVIGDGIPTQMLVALRQMKSLNIAEGTLKTAKMSTIQNKYTILWLAKMIKEPNGIQHYSDIGNLIFSAPSNSIYAISVMKQAGYRVKSGSLTKSLDPGLPTTETTVAGLLELKDLKIVESDIIDFGLSLDDKTFYNFNIIFELEKF